MLASSKKDHCQTKSLYHFLSHRIYRIEAYTFCTTKVFLRLAFKNKKQGMEQKDHCAVVNVMFKETVQYYLQSGRKLFELQESVTKFPPIEKANSEMNTYQ